MKTLKFKARIDEVIIGDDTAKEIASVIADGLTGVQSIRDSGENLLMVLDVNEILFIY